MQSHRVAAEESTDHLTQNSHSTGEGDEGRGAGSLGGDMGSEFRHCRYYRTSYHP